MSKFKDCVETIKLKNPALGELIESKEILLSLAVAEIVSAISSDELNCLYNAIPEYYFPCRIFISKTAIGSDSANIAVKSLTNPTSKIIFPFMPIKQMPAFNPDAEIESLSYTIPVWESSIRKKCGETNFSEASIDACTKLLHALTCLEEATSEYITTIKIVLMQDKQ